MISALTQPHCYEAAPQLLRHLTFSEFFSRGLSSQINISYRSLHLLPLVFHECHNIIWLNGALRLPGVNIGVRKADLCNSSDIVGTTVLHSQGSSSGKQQRPFREIFCMLSSIFDITISYERVTYEKQFLISEKRQARDVVRNHCSMITLLGARQ